MLAFLENWFLAHPFFGTLLIMMVLDIVLGILLSVQQKRLSSDVSRRGMTRKVVNLVLVLVCEVLSRTTGIPGPREAASLFFMTCELISIVENAAALGAPIPPPLSAVLLQLRTMTGQGQQFRLGDSPQEHERIMRERLSAHPTPPLPDPVTDALDILEKAELP